MKKKIRELTYNDLGKQVVFIEPEDGDRHSGTLTSITITPTNGLVTIGRANINIKGGEFDLEVEVSD